MPSNPRHWDRRAYAISALLAIGFLSQGCLVWVDGQRAAVPRHPGPAFATAESAPRIRWVIHHTHSGDGDASSGPAGFAGGNSRREFKAAFESVQPTVPFLANAKDDEADPQFLLDLTTAVEERGILNAFFSGFTLGIIPWYMRSDVKVQATLRTVAGHDLISHESVEEIRGITQILLLPMLPWTLTHRLGNEIYQEPMRSALHAVAMDFAALRPDPSSGSPPAAATRDATE